MSVLTRRLTASDHTRIRLHLFLIPIYAWALFTWVGYARSVSTSGRMDSDGLVKGHDFVHFYVLGRIALERQPADLHSPARQAERTQAIAGADVYYAPANVPQVALIFAPFAWFRYDVAWILWAITSAALYMLSCHVLWQSQQALLPYRWVALVGALAFPPFAMLIGFGHMSSLVLVAFTAGYWALRSERRWLAGFALGCVFLKPPLGVILPFVFLYGREWRMIAGAASAVILQLLVAGLYFGFDVLVEYVAMLQEFGTIVPFLEQRPHQMHSLRSFFTVLLPWTGVAAVAYGLTAVLVTVAVAKAWREVPSLRLRYSLLLLGAVLVNPHVYVYDLVVIAPVFLLSAAWMLERGHISWTLVLLAYTAYYAPVVAAWVSATTHVQITVVALVALVWRLIRLAPRLDPVGMYPSRRTEGGRAS